MKLKWLYRRLDQIVIPIWFYREIRLNDIGDDVQQLQALLNQKYRTKLIEDGIYGVITMRLIERIQLNGGLRVTGTCDRRTLNIIENEPDGESPRHGIKKKHQNKQLLQLLILAMPLLIMVVFLCKPDLINLIFRKNGLGIIFFVSCMFWALLIIDKITGVEVSSQVLTEFIRYLRDFLQLHN